MSELRPDGAAISGTELWYHRLCRALRDQTVTGAMAKSLGNVDAHIASEVARSVIELPRRPDDVAAVPRLAKGRPGGDRLAAIYFGSRHLPPPEHLGAEVCFATGDDDQPLRQAADHRGSALRSVGR